MGRWWPSALAALGGAAGVGAAVVDPAQARAAAAQDWPPFVLVAGLLLIGLVAHEEGLFSAAGQMLARRARGGWVLFAGAVVLISVVTAVLNLDTSVAFLTPVLVYAARSRGEGRAPLLYGCLLLSNAASLLLPGSNLTNLIVLGHLHMSGARFASRTGVAWVAAVVITAVVVGVTHRASLATTVDDVPAPERPVPGLGTLGVAAAVGVVVSVSSPAVPVAAIGLAVVGIRLLRGRERLERVRDVLGLPVLVGLLGVAVALGAAGRAWDGPALLLRHLDVWATATLAAVVSVAVNNLPAASLLAARVPRHPIALLVGLDVGPNLFVTGSLAWFLWLRAAATVGERPSVRHAARLGAVAVPLSMVAAVAALLLAAGATG